MIHTPPTRSSVQGASGGVLGRGGNLVGAGDSVVPCGGHEVSRRWKLHHRREYF